MSRDSSPAWHCGRSCVLAWIACFGLALAVALLALAPMRQALLLLPSFSHGLLHGTEASGLWHDGGLRLVCRLPAGRSLDCGAFDFRVGLANDGPPGLRADALQPGGGKAAGLLAFSGWQVQTSQFRLPMSTLAMMFPLAGQMQLGGVAWIDGRLESSGRGGFDIRWQGMLGGFPVGLQRMRAEITAGQVELRFVPASAAAEASRPMRADGGVRCALGGAVATARCHGRIDIELSDADPRLEAMIAATSRRTAPGRYHMLVDAR